MTEATEELTDALTATATRLGFLRLGVARAGPSRHRAAYLDWLAKGQHGTMDYMARHVARRVDPRETLPGAMSVIVVSLPYQDQVSFPPAGATGRGKIARYARGRDYHKVLRARLEKLADFVRDGERWRCWWTVDTGPLLERDWAEESGVGWIGKNCLVLDAETGSYFFLGALVTDRRYRAHTPAVDHCGTCRACLDACPTQAFVAPRRLDARRCISYLTIEHRGPVDSATDPGRSGWVFGCDICQEVCPFNQRRNRVRPPICDELTPRALPDDLATLSSMDRAGFLEAFRGTAIMRATDAGLARNAELVAKNQRADGGGA
ncbi:MAG: tRNA epoxyqueuosine(34) reductase QueG [Planctomycetota bacterium]